MRTDSERVRREGAGRDKVLAHITPEEAALLARLYGYDINPKTGLPQFGWLQDLASEFSIRRPLELIRDPHKFFELNLTKSMQSHVGPFALQFLGPWGKLGSLAAQAWLAHERGKGVYGGAYHSSPPPDQGKQNVMGFGTTALGAATIPSTGGSKSKTSPDAALFLQLQELKQQLIDAYTQAGRADDPQLQQDLQNLQIWYARQIEGANA